MLVFLARQVDKKRLDSCVVLRCLLLPQDMTASGFKFRHNVNTLALPNSPAVRPPYR